MYILFVCTGNTCRSSMAEGIFKYMIKEKNIENIHVSSAGISTFEGESANEKAIRTLAGKGIDISNHRSRQLTKQIISESDLILTMTLRHKKIIVDAAPEYSDRVYTLKEFALIINGEETERKNLDIADPYGLNYNVYESSAKEIEERLNIVVNNIQITIEEQWRKK